jgi:hypothetical protein
VPACLEASPADTLRTPIGGHGLLERRAGVKWPMGQESDATRPVRDAAKKSRLGRAHKAKVATTWLRFKKLQASNVGSLCGVRGERPRERS